MTSAITKIKNGNKLILIERHMVQAESDHDVDVDVDLIIIAKS